MPHMDGLAVMDQLNQIAEASYLPILMLTGDMTPEARREALSRGAKDFVNKPFHSDEVLLRIRHAARNAVPLPPDPEPEPDARGQGARADARARSRRRSRSSSGWRARRSSATTTPASTPSASARWRRCSPREIGLPDSQVSLIRRAAPLHDVGKIGIPDSILLKLGKLTDDEFALVKTHTTIGARILSGSRFASCGSPRRSRSATTSAGTAAATPGSSATRFRWPGRIVAVADVFDALTQKRPYKAAWPIADAIAEIERQRGRQFDPTLVDAFLRVIDSASAGRPATQHIAA